MNNKSNEDKSVVSMELVDVAITIVNILTIKISEPFDALISVSNDGVAENAAVLIDSEDVDYGNTKITEVVGFSTTFVAMTVTCTGTVYVKNMLSLLLILILILKR